jgi:hypothetical protein
VTVTKVDEETRRGYVIDPHEGTCDGQHNLAVMQFPLGNGWSDAYYTWGMAAMLSRAGTEEFKAAFEEMLRLGDDLNQQRGLGI